MSSAVNRIESLLQYLPQKDIPYAQTFLIYRDFDSLKEIVDSALQKVKRNLKKENPKEEYLQLSIEDLSRLKSEVDNYRILINGVDDDNDYDINDEDTDIEWY
jgi:hypothetical protein